MENIVRKLPLVKLERRYGRIVGEISSSVTEEEISPILSTVFGIANWVIGYLIARYETKNEDARKTIENVGSRVIELLRDKQFERFAINAKRSDKNFSLTSMEVNVIIGELIQKKLNKKVDLTTPDITCYLEIADGDIVCYFNKSVGLGGLPVGVSGKVVSLISGGIDSPVASFKMMSRGCEIVYVHFHSYPQTDRASIEKVKRLIGILNSFQGKSTVFFVPLLDIQKYIVVNGHQKSAVILYRRSMMRMALIIAKRVNAEALVTGESVGQVASQTLSNVRTISEAVSFPLLRPLIGSSKQEIIDCARKIGTYTISIEPHEDCCSLFIPVHPKTKSEIDETRAIEKKLEIDALEKRALEEVEIVHY